MSAGKEEIIARIERMPVSRWHTFVRVVLGICTFFDAYDAVVIAFVLPALIGLWSLGPAQIGFLLSAGFAGQLVGSSLFGWIGNRWGRIFALNRAILMISLFGLASAFAWSYAALVVFRFMQGIGIGGEIPVAACYVNEISSGKRRGRFVLLYQAIYPIGFLAASLLSIWVVPRLGWQWMFAIGSLPALVMIVIQRYVPESPRWLAENGRYDEADKIVTSIEEQIFGKLQRPNVTVSAAAGASKQTTAGLAVLFHGYYLRRTLCVWVMWFCANLIGYGVLVWLPSLFRTVYKLPVSVSLQYSLLSSGLIFAVTVGSALVIDRLGRKLVFSLSFLITALALTAIWAMGQPDAAYFMALAAVALMTISATQVGLWTYTPEIYPTNARSLGTGVASSWARLASMLGPTLVGLLFSFGGAMSTVFLGFALAGFLGAAAVLLFGTETAGQTLEQLSPDPTEIAVLGRKA